MRVSAGSHFDISMSTNINISIIKIRKIFVIRGYISISIRKWKKFHTLCLCLCLCNPGSHIFFLFFLRLCLCLCLCICQSVNRAALKCLAQEHNTMSPGRALTKSVRSRDEQHTNHGVAAPPQDTEHRVKTCF